MQNQSRSTHSTVVTNRSRYKLSLLASLVTAATLTACAPSPGAAPQPEPTVVAGDDAIRLNQLQLIGSHNSYHTAPQPEILTPLILGSAIIPALTQGLGNPLSLNYTHAPLPAQLQRGIRSFELDIYADPSGGRFAHPRLIELFGLGNPLPAAEMAQPGFKVIHIADVDFISSCFSLASCLTQIRTWSDAHPGHLPIVINIELKGDTTPVPAALEFTPVLPYDGPLLDAVDNELRSLVGDRLITPDDVRGDAVDLHTAITTTGWPTVKDSRGKILFFMDNADLRDLYLTGHPSLRERVMFTSSTMGEPDSAIVKMNEPGDGSAIRAAVQAGYIVRTRADGVEPENPPTVAQRDVALASGAQIVHSDFPPGEAQWVTNYVVSFGTKVQGRCDPVTTTPDTCAAAATIEP